jgi:hypothetical protein
MKAGSAQTDIAPMPGNQPILTTRVKLTANPAIQGHQIIMVVNAPVVTALTPGNQPILTTQVKPIASPVIQDLQITGAVSVQSATTRVHGAIYK